MSLCLSDETKEKTAPVAFVTVEKGARSGIKDRQFIAIRNEKEWESLWARHKSTFSPMPKIPSVDFDREMVVAVFSGEKRTGGYGIEIQEIEENREKGEIAVFYVEKESPPRSIVIQTLTQPYHIVRLKKIDLPVTFVPVKLH